MATQARTGGSCGSGALSQVVGDLPAAGADRRRGAQGKGVPREGDEARLGLPEPVREQGHGHRAGEQTLRRDSSVLGSDRTDNLLNAHIQATQGSELPTART